MENKHYIYIIKNIVNNKIYVGCTKNFEQRKKTHLSRMRNKKHCNKFLENEFYEFGDNNFSFYIIEECEENEKIRKRKILDSNL